MNRNQYLDPHEVLTAVGEDFIIEKGQVLKEKQFDDEYILILDVGESVTAEMGDHVGEEPYDVRYITCDSRGVPHRRRGKHGISSDAYWQKHKISGKYWFIRKASEDSVLLCENKDEFEQRNGIRMTGHGLEVVDRPDKDRRTIEEKAEDEAYEAAERQRVLRAAGIHGVVSVYRNGADPNGTSSSDMPIRHILI